MIARFRAMTPADRAFVVSMWSSSFRMSESAGLISMETWASVMHREVERIIDHPAVKTLVAWSPAAGVSWSPADDFLYGFIAYAHSPYHPYVYYVAVKTPYRRGRSRLGLPAGFAEQLFAAAGIDPRKPFRYACKTPYVSELHAKIPLADYDPLPARFLRYPHEHTQPRTEERNASPAPIQGGEAADDQDLGDRRRRSPTQRPKQR